MKKLTKKQQQQIERAMGNIATGCLFSCVALAIEDGTPIYKSFLARSYAEFYGQNPTVAWDLDTDPSFTYIDQLIVRKSHRLLLLALFLHVGSTEGL